jgi:hypothetical protein
MKKFSGVRFNYKINYTKFLEITNGDSHKLLTYECVYFKIKKYHVDQKNICNLKNNYIYFYDKFV